MWQLLVTFRYNALARGENVCVRCEKNIAKDGILHY